jgi:predicted DNA-binding transcriptional regulator AlpA
VKIGRPFGPILKSMGELERFTGRDESVIRRWVAEQNFPAAMLDGRWMAVKADVERWLREQIAAKNNRAPVGLAGQRRKTRVNSE